MDKASVVRMVLAILAAVKLVLQPFGIEIPQDLIDSIADLAAAVVVVWTAFKNNYLTKKGLAQKEVLKKEGLAK
ncbi:phage holin [Caenibacillus caldisaponilyticus]|uniref:phage holin n=1 Tax=Caenibacillus caldisaponilyticus TaxID=1674942 RepID=UPI0009884782|nr:phage holin [Caenibacillus caldisaponilyticus]